MLKLICVFILGFILGSCFGLLTGLMVMCISISSSRANKALEESENNDGDSN